MKAFDIGGSRREYAVGSRRYLAVRYERHEGHECDDSCESRGLEECFGEETRAFPNRGLATGYAARNPGLWGGSVVEELFDHIGNHDGMALGSWDRVGVAVEVEPLDAGEVKP